MNIMESLSRIELPRLLAAMSVALICALIPNETWTFAMPSMLVVVGILSAAMFSRSGNRTPIEDVIGTDDVDLAEKQAGEVLAIQDFLAQGVARSIVFSVLQLFMLIFVTSLYGGKSGLNQLIEIIKVYIGWDLTYLHDAIFYTFSSIIKAISGWIFIKIVFPQLLFLGLIDRCFICSI